MYGRFRTLLSHMFIFPVRELYLRVFSTVPNVPVRLLDELLPTGHTAVWYEV